MKNYGICLIWSMTADPFHAIQFTIIQQSRRVEDTHTSAPYIASKKQDPLPPTCRKSYLFELRLLC